MEIAYICSPYSAADEEKKERNVQYARELTRLAIDMGFAPITPHLYLTQCIDDEKPAERKLGMGAALELLKLCDVVIIGAKHGISEGMRTELKASLGKATWLLEV